jgi:hypothetical protein
MENYEDKFKKREEEASKIRKMIEDKFTEGDKEIIKHLKAIEEIFYSKETTITIGLSDVGVRVFRGLNEDDDNDILEKLDGCFVEDETQTVDLGYNYFGIDTFYGDYDIDTINNLLELRDDSFEEGEIGWLYFNEDEE